MSTHKEEVQLAMDEVTNGELFRAIQGVRDELVSMRESAILRVEYDERKTATDREIRDLKRDIEKLDTRMSSAEKRLWAFTGGAATIGGALGSALSLALGG